MNEHSLLHPHWPASFPRRILRYGLLLSGAVTTTALGIASYSAGVLNRPNRQSHVDGYTFSPWELQAPFEAVSFQTADGLTLRGWWLPSEGSDRVAIGLTGHRGAKHDLLGIGTALWRAHNNVLLFDFRACGESDRAPLSLAHYELADVRAALAYVRHRIPGARVGIVGYSMGASLAILAAAEDPGIAAVVADSPFASISDVVAFAFRRRRLPAPPLVALTDIVNRLRYGYRFNAVRPVDAVSAIAPRPLLLIHGTDDTVIPVQHAYDLAARLPGKTTLWVLPGVQHCGAYFADREEYVRRVTTFIDTAMSMSDRNEGAESWLG